MVEFCAERGLCVGNTYFEYKSLHKYTGVPRGQDGVEVKDRIDLVLVKRGYGTLCAGCKGSERNRIRLLRSPRCTV